MAPPEMACDAAFGQRGLAGYHFFVDHQLRIEEFLRTTTEHRQRPVGRHTADGLVVVEIVAELGHVSVVLVLAIHQLRLEQAVLPQPLAQLADQRGVFGPALAQQVAHAIEHGEGVGKAALGVDEGGGLSGRIERRVGE